MEKPKQQKSSKSIHPKTALEIKVLEIPIAYISNVDITRTISDVIEFEDVELSLDLFKNCFYHNYYKYFEINEQFQNIDELQLQNKKIKHINFNNYKTNKTNMVDIMCSKFIKNKKRRVSDLAKISFIKEINSYKSLTNFGICNHSLSFNDITTIYNEHTYRKSKKYLRFKIKVVYYSIDLDEDITLIFNYLVKIPGVLEDCSSDTESIINELDVDEEDVVEEYDNVHENIVYSNYIEKKVNNKNLLNSLENICELDKDDEDDDSECNISTSSFGDNEDTFF
jgi:hypothetical protein